MASSPTLWASFRTLGHLPGNHAGTLERGGTMKEATRGIAFTVVLVVLVSNFLLPRPLVPTLPHKSWDWLTPWPIQVVRAGELEPLETLIKLTFAAELIREFLQGLQRLAAESLYQMIRDAIQQGGTSGTTSSSGPAGGGGGEIFTER